MEILGYLITILITYFGVTHFIIMLIAGLLNKVLNYSSENDSYLLYGFGNHEEKFWAFSWGCVPISIGLWLTIDYIWVTFLGQPLSIGLIFLCWLAILIDDWIKSKRVISSGVLRSSTSIHVHMAEAWVLWIWAIASIFLEYRAWI